MQNPDDRRRSPGRTSLLVRRSSRVAAAVALLLGAATFRARADDMAGPVIGWGANVYGQTNVPAGLTTAIAVAGGLEHSLALRPNGTVVAWGRNEAGQTNVPVTATATTAIAAGQFHGLALQSNGTVIAWGLNNQGQTNVPASVTNAVAVAAGGLHSLALLADGSVLGWGYNAEGETDVPASVSNATAIAAGTFHSLALLADGRVIGWGDNGDGQTNVPASVTNAVDIAAGYEFSAALTADGRVIAWGANNFGQTNVPASVTNAVAIAAGGYHALALRANDTLASWGATSQGQALIPAGLKNISAIAGGGGHSLAIFLTNAPPVIECPSTVAFSTTLTNALSAAVGVALFDNDGDALEVIWSVNGGAPVTNNVPAGSGGVTSTNLALAVTLPLGTNTVLVTVRDGVTEPVECEVQAVVTQLDIRGQLEQALADLDALITGTTDEKLLKTLTKAQTGLSESVNGLYWDDGNHPDPLTGKSVFKLVGKSASGLAKLLKKPAPGLDASAVDAILEQLVNATREAAVLAFEEVIAADGDPKGIDKAELALAAGDLAAAEANAKKAISSYGKAWSAALKAMPIEG